MMSLVRVTSSSDRSAGALGRRVGAVLAMTLAVAALGACDDVSVCRCAGAPGGPLTGGSGPAAGGEGSWLPIDGEGGAGGAAGSSAVAGAAGSAGATP